MPVLLIAEDDEDIALVLTRVFKRAGMTVLRAADGQAALELIVEHHPDVVVTDLGMPRMDGWELIAAVRSRPEVADTPIAILSGHLRPGDPRAGTAQCCAILLKPCPNDQLLATVRELLAIGPHDHDSSESRCPAEMPVSV
ncbi:response regulator [Actinoplanes missouriensis]|nr:response regulator [Actinoplanes missouriensis]